MNAYKLFPDQGRTANRHDLDLINWMPLRGSWSHLSKPARSWAAFYRALSSLGYSRVRAPMAALVDVHARAGGVSVSLRSAYRAHTELEKHGLIMRRSCRIKDVSEGSDIVLCDKYLHVPKRQTFDLNIQKSSLRTAAAGVGECAAKVGGDQESTPAAAGVGECSSVENSASVSGHTRENRKEQDKIKNRAKPSIIHPFLYTLGIVARRRMGIEGARIILDFAEQQLYAGGMLGKWAGNTGRSLWWSMMVCEREFAAGKILNELACASPSHVPRKQKKKITEIPIQHVKKMPKQAEIDYNPVSLCDLPEELRQQIARLSGRTV